MVLTAAPELKKLVKQLQSASTDEVRMAFSYGISVTLIETDGVVFFSRS
jgi:hypothetical protein